jgi:hypothetical protein
MMGDKEERGRDAAATVGDGAAGMPRLRLL